MIGATVNYVRLMVLTTLIAVVSCSGHESSHTKAEALYLLETLRQISDFTENKLPESHPLLFQMETYAGEKYSLAPGQQYVWFSMSPESIEAMQKARISVSDASQSFAGFFLIIDDKRRVLDFGWHKP
jgi:hypothetical protein